jgi:hypothetical protein
MCKNATNTRKYVSRDFLLFKTQPSIVAFVQIHKNTEKPSSMILNLIDSIYLYFIHCVDTTMHFDEFFPPFYVKKNMSLIPILEYRGEIPINACFGRIREL